MTSLSLYFTLQRLIFKRILKEDFPIVILIVFAGILGLFMYAIVTVHIAFTWSNCLIISIFYMALLQLSYKNYRKEKLFLHNLQLPYLQIRVIKNLLIAIPFLIFNFYIGLICCMTGIIALFEKMVPKSALSIPSIYLKSAYRWHIGFRKGGILIVLASLFLMIEGGIHGNERLGVVALGVLLCGSSFFAIFGEKENDDFLRMYGNSRNLMKHKTLESIINSLIVGSAGFLVAVIFWHTSLSLFILILFSGLYVNLSMVAAYYRFYPSAFFSFWYFVLTVFMGLTVFISLWFIPLALILLATSFYFAIKHLQSTIYGEHTC